MNISQGWEKLKKTKTENWKQTVWNKKNQSINQHHCWFSSNCELAEHALCARCTGVISERKVEEGLSSPWRIQIIPISANENDTHKHPEDYIPFLICKTDQWKFGSNVWQVESRQKWLLLEKLTLVPDLTLLRTALGDISHVRKPTAAVRVLQSI